MLRLDLKPGGSVRIGPFAVITLEDKSGKTARIAFQADRSVPITRVKEEPAAEPTRGIMGIGAAQAAA